jgi:hypothetical protein
MFSKNNSIFSILYNSGIGKITIFTFIGFSQIIAIFAGGIDMKQKIHTPPSFVILFFAFFLGFALKGQDSHSTSEKLAGPEQISLTTDGGIRDVLIDEERNRIYILSRATKKNKWKNHGKLTAVSLGNYEPLWSTDIDFEKNSVPAELHLSEGGHPFVSMKLNVYSFNKENGEQRWYVHSNDFRVHPNDRLFLGNPTVSLVSLYNSDTGEEVWKYDTRFKDTKNILFSSDSCMMVLEKGIHHVKLSNGATWFRKIKGLNSYNSFNVGARAGIIGGSTLVFGLLGAFVSAAATSGMPAAVGNKAQNYLLENEVIYVAADELSKLNCHSDSLIWTAGDLSRKRGVSAIISLDEKSFLLVDYGYKYNSSGMRVRNGDASCEYYNKESGKFLRGLRLHTEGSDFITDFVILNNTISFLGNRSLFSVGLDTLDSLTKAEFGTSFSNIGLDEFVDPNDYREVNGKFSRVADELRENIYIRSKANKVVEFNSDLKLIKVLDDKTFYTFVEKYKGYLLLANTEESVIIDEAGKRIFTDDLSSKAWLSNGYLVDFTSNKATLIKLD